MISWFGPGTVIGWEHKQVLVKHGGTYVRVHPSRLAPCPETYKSSSEDKDSEPTAHQNLGNETSQVPIYDKNDMEESLETPIEDDNVEQHLTMGARGRPLKQKSSPKTIELPKPGQTIKCRLANDDDSEWRKFNVISRAGKAKGKNKYLMNVVMEQGEPFWLDFEHGVSEWQANEVEQTEEPEHTSCDEGNVMISSSNDDIDQAKKKELHSWIENQVYTQVPDQGQPKISTRWIYTNKKSNGKQICKARLVARGFQDTNVNDIRHDSPTCSKEGLRIALGIMASHGWTCKSMDIKTAFLQSKQLDRLVYLSPLERLTFLQVTFGNFQSVYMA